jgi:hypothetical protein
MILSSRNGLSTQFEISASVDEQRPDDRGKAVAKEAQPGAT